MRHTCDCDPEIFDPINELIEQGLGDVPRGTRPEDVERVLHEQQRESGRQGAIAKKAKHARGKAT